MSGFRIKGGNNVVINVAIKPDIFYASLFKPDFFLASNAGTSDSLTVAIVNIELGSRA